MRALVALALVFAMIPMALAHDGEAHEAVCDVDVKIVDGTLYRCDHDGPVATVVCDGTSATASWVLPLGQTLSDHPELGTAGYVYFTTEEKPSTTLLGGRAAADFAGRLFDSRTLPISIEVDGLEYGRTYRAHLLAAYDDGRLIHNDTRFVCEEPGVQAPAPSPPTTVAPKLDTIEDRWQAIIDLIVALCTGMFR